MAKLTDLQRKQMIADRVLGMSFRKLAEKYNVTTATVQRVIKSDTKVAQKVTDKKEENTQTVLAYMEEQREQACNTIGKLLEALGNDDKIALASLNQIATSMGILIDKFTAIEGNGGKQPENNLLDAIQNAVKETNDEIREDKP